MEKYEVVWLGKDGEVLDAYEVIKEYIFSAFRSGTSRLRQSPHLVPAGTCGVHARIPAIPGLTLQERLDIYNKENP